MAGGLVEIHRLLNSRRAFEEVILTAVAALLRIAALIFAILARSCRFEIGQVIVRG